MTTNNPELFERALRFHSVGSILSPYKEQLGGGMLAAFASCNFRMSEFTGAVLKGQLQKLETICSGLRRNARKVREGIADLPGLKLRKTPDQDGDLGVTVFLDMDTRERRDRFLRALRAEGIAARGPGGSAILPTKERIENKLTIHPNWPSFNSPEGKKIQYGPDSCRQTLDVFDRFVQIRVGAKYTQRINDHIIDAVRQAYNTLV